ncbi:unnamed protein product [Linum tenue]|uniref:Uncharacterized protein n=1 Tax=Linum tenue TaxID=586396 RepID=A0AAV0HZU5_9ROSI|nr:unnamed protein product [Linum tenue]
MNYCVSALSSDNSSDETPPLPVSNMAYIRPLKKNLRFLLRGFVASIAEPELPRAIVCLTVDFPRHVSLPPRRSCQVGICKCGRRRTHKVLDADQLNKEKEPGKKKVGKHGKKVKETSPSPTALADPNLAAAARRQGNMAREVNRQANNRARQLRLRN